MLRQTFGLGRLDAWRSALSTKLQPTDSIDVAAERVRKLVTTACRGEYQIVAISALIRMESLPRTIKDQVWMQIGNEISHTSVLRGSKKIGRAVSWH